MKIIDKFLDTNDFTDLKNTLTSDKFPWYLNHGVKEKLGIVSLVRAKFNLLHRTDDIIEHQPHIDIPNPPDNLKTAILYLNTNNGYTKFEDGNKVLSEENRLVIFDGKLKHWGSTNSCSEPYRIVFNLNYF